MMGFDVWNFNDGEWMPAHCKMVESMIFQIQIMMYPFRMDARLRFQLLVFFGSETWQNIENDIIHQCHFYSWCLGEPSSVHLARFGLTSGECTRPPKKQRVTLAKVPRGILQCDPSHIKASLSLNTLCKCAKASPSTREACWAPLIRGHWEELLAFRKTFWSLHKLDRIGQMLAWRFGWSLCVF